MKVLVIEDSKPNSLIICAVIRGMKHEPIPVASGEDAIEIFQKQSFDLILMDVEMPGIDGFETTRRLRSLMGDLWIPIIFLSANDDESHIAEGINAGGDDYLTKPVKPIIVQSKIRAMARISGMRNELSKANEKLYHANEELERLSYLDGLTGVMNRRGFEKNYLMEWRRSQRENTPLGVLMIDIDEFKKYNDGYGHLNGDDCLKKVAETLNNTVRRPGDIVARYGGEEFIILLPNTDLEGAHYVASHLVENVRALKIAHLYATHNHMVTISVGISGTELLTKPFSDEILLESADKALYAAKDSGRNKCVVYQPDTKTLRIG